MHQSWTLSDATIRRFSLEKMVVFSATALSARKLIALLPGALTRAPIAAADEEAI